MVFNHWLSTKNEEFGNARDVRKYLEQCIDTLYERLEIEYGDEIIPDKEKTTLTGEDIPKGYWSLLS